MSNLDRLDNLSTNMFDINVGFGMEQTNDLEAMADYNPEGVDTKSLRSIDTQQEEQLDLINQIENLEQ